MKQLLYILKFEKYDFIKIGITKNISSRILRLQNETGMYVDHLQSRVYTNPKSQEVVLLERNLLSITKSFDPKVDWNKTFGGINEFRAGNCIDVIEKFIGEQKTYGKDFKLHIGIDICGNYNHGIPKSYFPIFYPVKGFSPELKYDIMKYCDSEKMRFVDFQHQACYFYLQHLTKVRDNLVIPKYDNYFKV
ncbi:hypothetical protein [Leeuwenhoekiella aestuarii]|uniref:Uncharacterized protein n=1 Tax=Leeuwenhoekiella aestuarii TaxID=2249426 RepID=A0A4Q0NWK1_9FLAO|nr:hypothetical protein [Leeuwenhoekiella aestuarii]RXG16556.1 hypothetical protein DSM04_102129 [Leeuwenhoekiella aestuarii]